jgi:hypothetical protein
MKSIEQQLEAESKAAYKALAAQRAQKRRWFPITEAPVEPFDQERRFLAHSRAFLVWANWAQIATYHYTKRGKGRWKSQSGHVIQPTHFAYLPKGPAQ